MDLSVTLLRMLVVGIIRAVTKVFLQSQRSAIQRTVHDILCLDMR